MIHDLTADGSVITTLMERTTRFVALGYLGQERNADTVRDSLVTTIRKMPDTLRSSLTWDQDAEMAEHRGFTVATDLAVHFADPGSP